ncbi:PilZ domain-containing protein [Hyalangium versicolor]|uniref:PilZ domain-containing protein n=1 Tax=Hyalangium versicolor TaxID=2861190 RepID=UPI001CCB7C45|nr:PilZ domain-containing protein [Hyalangium versicolor]
MLPTANPRTADRFHPRVEARLMVKVLLSGRPAVLAKARDVSMAGLFLHAHPASSLSELTLAIPLPDDREITATCTIVRREPNGVALEFGTLDWDDFLALARYVHPLLP